VPVVINLQEKYFLRLDFLLLVASNKVLCLKF
jgi:hypothetical protein